METSAVDLIRSMDRISKTWPGIVTNARGNSSAYGRQYEGVQSDETTVICALACARPNVPYMGWKELKHRVQRTMNWACGYAGSYAAMP